ncbi:MAG: hypothetical protein U0325_15250 [Polyangiales bacterium]
MSLRALVPAILLTLACASRPASPPRTPPVIAPPAVVAPAAAVEAAPVARVDEAAPSRAEEDAHELVPDNPTRPELAARPPLPATPAGRSFRGLDPDALMWRCRRARSSA